MIHVLGSDVPHHNATVLRFFDRVPAPPWPARPRFWVAAANPAALGEHPNLDVTTYPTRRAVVRSVVATAIRDRTERFFLHGQFSPELWLALLSGAIRPHQVDWHIWGADLYEAAEGRRAELFYRMRRAAQGRVGRVHGTLGDLDHYRRHHPGVPTSVLYFPTRMPDATAPSAARTPPVPSVPSVPGLTVLVGNSGDRSNRHVEALRTIRGQFGPETRVLIPFGYPPDNEAYARVVRAEAHRLFRSRNVRMLGRQLALDDYAALLAECDLGYFLAPRQQGIGTLSLLIRQGVPFVLSRDNTFTRDLTGQRVPFLLHGDLIDAVAVRQCRDRLRSVEWSGLSFTPENCVPGWRQALRADAVPGGGCQARFSFDFCFSLAFALTSYLGVPLTLLLVLGFGDPMVPAGPLAGALLLPLAGYAVYRVAYEAGRPAGPPRVLRPVLRMSRRESMATAAVLALLAGGALARFISLNGLLLLRITSYGQALAKDLRGMALKRFAYFFLPAALIGYCQHPSRRRWFAFLAVTAAFGALTYVAVGGTRANLVMSFALFVFLGLADGHLPPWMLAPLGAAGVVAMYLLAQGRYRLDSTGWKRLYNFLFLTRDTLSPWEHLALILRRRSAIEFQGLAPIARDFHVYLPRRIWPSRPEITLNTPKYFTWRVYGGERATTLSPTLIGSSYLMGGLPGVLLGAGASGLIVRGFDRLLDSANQGADRYGDAVVKAFCFGSLFNLIVLVREGLDSFVSRFVIYTSVFGASVGAAKVASRLLPDRTAVPAERSPDQPAPDESAEPGGPVVRTAARHELRGIEILGYRNEKELVDELFDGAGTRTGIMVAINAEKVVVSERNPALRRVIAEAEFCYADGISIVRSIRRKYGVQIDRIPGVELWQSMMRRAGELGTSVFVVGGRPAVLDVVQRRLRDEWQVNVVGSRHGYFDAAERAALIDRIRRSGASIVTVALGSPKQELFMRECRQVHPDALYIGVGGTFDIVSGATKRAPEVFRRLQLEWFYRIASQPTRLGRLGRVARYAAYHYGDRL